MKPDIDTIVKDLLTQNPDLAIEASTLRALVAEMVAHQPVVSVDDAFRARLRAELLARVAVPKEKRLALPWWLIYTVPFGVTAVLLLVVQPSPSSVPIPPAATPTPDARTTGDVPPDTATYESAPAMMMDMGDMGGGASKKAAESSDAATSASFAEDAMLYDAPTVASDFFTADFTPDRKAIQFTYMVVSAPVFVRITSPDGSTLASGLLAPGEYTDLLLPMGTTIARGGTYTATLYHDNGDGVFTMDGDTPVLDASGSPVSLTLIP
jgi:hypothetical protein